MNELEKARQIIDNADKKMAELFVERMNAAATVAEYKKQNGFPIFDLNRELEVVRKNSELISDGVLRDYYVNFINDVMKTSKAYQSRLVSGMKIAYSGTLGAFAHIAAGKIFPSGIRVPYGNFRDAYDSVVSGESDCAVLPIENSFAGEVGQVIDMLFSGSLYISGIYDLPVIHDLVSVAGATKSQIKTVVSHPQALSQCAEYIRSNGFSQIQYENTAKAAEYVKEKNNPEFAAICSRECAEIFGLSVIERHINESRSNTTRFGVFTRSKPLTPDISHDKSERFILMFTVQNKAGALADVINILGTRGYNMISLRSRPMKELLWNYYFYVECERSADNEENINTLLERLSNVCDKLKLVGAYRPIIIE